MLFDALFLFNRVGRPGGFGGFGGRLMLFALF
jgi:hypothetical protein